MREPDATSELPPVSGSLTEPQGRGFEGLGGDPVKIGPYTILGRLGAGGMGIVYLAEQERPRRTVALKVILPERATAELLRRFEHESHLLGRLQHPGIARIYEAGSVESPAGPRPYFAMELVRGQSFTRYAAGRALETRDRVALMIKVCEAVQHAHQKGIIHRDLKPGNILVDDEGQPKVLDFGLARMIVPDSSLAVSLTDAGQVLGTLSYMSPEQVAADPDQIDTRSDVYSLGVIAFELLAGRLPYEVRGRGYLEALRIIREGEPTPPSTLNPALRGDLETILSKALAKDRDRRYASASEFAADLGRYLADEPIVARPPSAFYLIRKFAQRHRLAVAALATVAAGLVLLVVGIALALASESRLRVAEHKALLAERDKSREAEARARLLEENQRLTEARQADSKDRLMQRGQWREAIEAIDRALAAGHPNALRLRLDRVRCLAAINHATDAVAELARIEGQRAGLGAAEGEYLLWKADVVLGRAGADESAVVARVREAIRRGLPPADDAYARGLLAEDFRAAAVQFRRALQHDPFHLRARSLLALVLLIQADFDALRPHLAASEALFPEDPDLRVIDAFMLSIRGETAASRASLERARPQLGETQFQAFRTTLGVIETMLAAEEDRFAADLSGRLPALIASLLALQWREDVQSIRMLETPPPFLRAYVEGIVGASKKLGVAALFGGRKWAIADLNRALAVHPEAALLLLRGLIEAKDGRQVDAERSFREATDAPTLMPLTRRAALYELIMSQGYRIDRGDDARDPALKARTAGDLRRFLALGPLRGVEPYNFWQVAALAGDFDLAREFATTWSRLDPKNLDALGSLGWIESKLGNLTRTLELAREIERRKPGDPAARRLLATVKGLALQLRDAGLTPPGELPADPFDRSEPAGSAREKGN